MSNHSSNIETRAALSIREVASLLGVSTFTIHRRIKDGTLKAFKFGHRQLIPIPVLMRLLGDEEQIAFEGARSIAGRPVRKGE
jgi:excisionase family DNA binding protein